MWYNGVMKHNRFVLALSLISLAGLILMLQLTSPVEIGPFGVLLFFTMVYIVLFGTMVFGFKLFYRLALKRDNFRGKDYLYAAVAAFGPIMLLMARSFGVVSLWTVILVGIFVFLVEFLVCKKI